MTVLLSRPYAGYAAPSTVKLPANVEQSLIAQGLASAASTANITPGPVTTNANSGTIAVPAGSASVVITNSQIDGSSKVWACVAQAAADATALRVERIVVAVGSVTIYVTANATAATLVDWAIIVAPGLVLAN